MKKWLIILIVLIPCVVLADETNLSISAYYWAHHNGYTNTSGSLKEIINMVSYQKGRLSWICWNADSWKIGSPPTKSELETLWPQAKAWCKDREADWKEMLKILSPVEKALMKLLISKGVFTKAEMKAALKAEL